MAGHEGWLQLRAYSSAVQLAAPLVALALAHRVATEPDGAESLPQRFGVASLPRPDGPLLWVHAVSLGEGAAAAPLLDALRRAHPTLTVLLTAGSAPALAARAASPHWAGVLLQLAPLDTPAAAARFLAHWRPCAAIFIESELWPNTLEAASAAHIPVALVNARMSPRSARRWGGAFAAPLVRRLLRRLRLVSAMNATEAARLTALCPGVALGPTADLKAVAGCAPWSADDATPGAALARGVAAARRSGRFVWLAASTHAGEELMAASAHGALLAAGAAQPLTLIAPRHPERGAAIAAALAAAHPSLRVALHSASATTPVLVALASADVYVVDALGLLPMLYAACGVAFVGNSLTPRGGGHNLAEAAAAGAAVLHGPRLGPFADMAAALSALSGDALALQRVADAAELGAALVALRDDPAEVAARGAAAARASRQLGDGVLQPLLCAVEEMLAAAMLA